MNRLLKATLVAGTLDILSAFVFSAMAGGTPGAVLRFVASGPFGEGMKTSPLGIPLGLLTHFAIMAVMVWAYFSFAPKFPKLTRNWVLAGLLYGLLLWVIMYWGVRPLRWPAMWLPDAWASKTTGQIAWSVGNALFSHCILVGLPIAWFQRRH